MKGDRLGHDQGSLDLAHFTGRSNPHAHNIQSVDLRLLNRVVGTNQRCGTCNTVTDLRACHDNH